MQNGRPCPDSAPRRGRHCPKEPMVCQARRPPQTTRIKWVLRSCPGCAGHPQKGLARGGFLDLQQSSHLKASQEALVPTAPEGYTSLSTTVHTALSWAEQGGQGHAVRTGESRPRAMGLGTEGERTALPPESARWAAYPPKGERPEVLMNGDCQCLIS